MKLDFESAAVPPPNPPHRIDTDRVARPMAWLRIEGPWGFRELRGLIDTGSDYTMFPISLADTLGIRTDETPVNIGGIGSGGLQAFFGEVVLEIGKKGHKGDWISRGWKWKTWIAFGLTPRILLGQDGFLHYFTATFTAQPGTRLQDPPQQQVNLKPNRLFRTVMVR